jgi:hypothetical protein
LGKGYRRSIGGGVAIPTGGSAPPQRSVSTGRFALPRHRDERLGPALTARAFGSTLEIPQTASAKSNRTSLA